MLVEAREDSTVVLTEGFYSVEVISEDSIEECVRFLQ